MPRPLLHWKDDHGAEWFCEWTTVSDGPITPALSEGEMRAWLREWYGRSEQRRTEERIATAREHGTTDGSGSFDAAVSCNRAGPSESRMPPEDLRVALVGWREGWPIPEPAEVSDG